MLEDLPARCVVEDLDLQMNGRVADQKNICTVLHKHIVSEEEMTTMLCKSRRAGEPRHPGIYGLGGDGRGLVVRHGACGYRRQGEAVGDEEGGAAGTARVRARGLKSEEQGRNQKVLW